MDISVMTFNLRNCMARDGDNIWANRIERAARAIRDNDPLIVGTQEGYRVMLDDLDSRLSGYAWLGDGREEGREGEHCAIFYRNEEVEVLDQGQFWLSEQPDQVGSKGWDAQCTRICTWAHFRSLREGKREFVVFNTHLDHRGQQAREQGIALIWRAIKEQRDTKRLPIILMGDFNVDPTNPVVQFLRGYAALGGESAQMTDAFSAMDGPVGATFHGFRGGVDGRPIDYIFVTPDVRVLQTKVDRRMIDGGYPSDHYPVTANLRLP